MPRIDFYFIPETTFEAKLRFACRVLEKAYSQKHQVYVHLDTAASAYQFNDLLWTFHDISFIPHAIVGEKLEIIPDIEIGFLERPSHQHDILLNLSAKMPAFFSDFDRTIEIVLNDEHTYKIQQENMLTYKEQGFSVNTFDIRK